MAQKLKVAVIGAGPAGHSAALYLARAGLVPVVISGPLPGGQAVFAGRIDNYPGFEGGIWGFELTQKMRAQAESFGAVYVDEVVTALDLSVPPYKVWTYLPEEINYTHLQNYSGDDWQGLSVRVKAEVEPAYEVELVVIATGSQACFLGLPEEKKWLGRGLAICATCDGNRYKGQEVVVVGGGDAAFNDVLYLAALCNKVTVVHSGETWESEQQEKLRRLAKLKNVDCLWKSQIVAFHGEADLEKVTVEDLATGQRSDLATAGVFLAIGRTPQTGLFAGQLDLTSAGHLVVAAKNGQSGLQTQTSVEGVFAAGDVVSASYNQVCVAAASGVMAAMDAIKYNSGHESASK